MRIWDWGVTGFNPQSEIANPQSPILNQTPAGPLMEIAGKDVSAVTDSLAAELAADRPEPLLRVLERQRSLNSLVIVLAFLPGFLAMQRHGMDDNSAVWALRALSGFESRDVFDFIDPGQTGRSETLSSQPPLATWLTALAMAAFGPFRIQAPAIVPMLAAAGCVWWTFRLVCGVCGSRVGFWAAVLLSTHGSLLLISTNSSPSALSLLLVLVFFDAWQRHFKSRTAMVSLWLLIAGLAMGLCLLSGGPVVIAVVGVLLLQPAINRVLPGANSEMIRNRRTERFLMRYGTALSVTLLTAFAVGGWWLMRAAGSNDEFWSDWLSGYDAATVALTGSSAGNAAEFSEAVDRAMRLCVVVGPILPLSIYGAFRALSSHRSSDSAAKNNDGRHRMRGFVLSWLVVGLIYHFLAPSWAWSQEPGRSLADVFLLIPAVSLAAEAIDSILQRELNFFGAILLTVMMLALLPFLDDWDRGRIPTLDFTWFAWALTGIAAVAVLAGGWMLLRWVGRHEFRRRVILGFLLCAQITAAFVSGFASLSPSAKDEQRLASLRSEVLAALRPEDAERITVSGIVLMTDAPYPARLEYAVRSIQPNTPWTEVPKKAGALGGIAARYDSGDSILVIEWISVRSRTTLVEIPGRELVAVGEPRFYRGRELRAFLLKPTAKK